jgi:hypothetical protein
VLTRAAEVLAKLIEPFAVQLGKLPRSVHQTAGWIAVLTLFNAGAVWAYVMLKSAPAYDEPIGKQPTLLDEHGKPVVPVVGKEPPPPPKAEAKDDHGGKKDDGHGGGAAKKDDHGAAKKKDDGHGGGH